MTVQHIWDIIKIDYPEVGETMVLALINNAQDTFADETECMRTSVDLTLTTAVTYDLPTDFDKLKKIVIADSDEVEVLGVSYSIDPVARTITFVDTEDVDATVLSTSVARITLDYIAKPELLTNLNQTPGLDKRFHMALVLLVKLLLGGDMAKFNRANALYQPLRLAAKRFGNSGSDRNATTIRQEDQRV